jgi:hypothetical protein
MADSFADFAQNIFLALLFQTPFAQNIVVRDVFSFWRLESFCSGEM